MLNSFSCKVDFISASFNTQRFRVKELSCTEERDIKCIRFEAMIISQRMQDRSHTLNEISKEKEKNTLILCRVGNLKITSNNLGLILCVTRFSGATLVIAAFFIKLST